MAEILRKIAQNQLARVPNGESTTLSSLWENNDVVIYFLRRFGCSVCRWISHNLNNIKPLLDENNVKLVGVGPEALGSKEFFDDKIFDGELYVDSTKKCYKDLDFGSISIIGAVGAAVDKKSREMDNNAKKENLGGNFKGDWYQMGGLLIVKKGGEEVIMNFKQNKVSDHVENADILKALGIKSDSAGPTAGEAPAIAKIGDLPHHCSTGRARGTILRRRVEVPSEWCAAWNIMNILR